MWSRWATSGTRGRAGVARYGPSVRIGVLASGSGTILEAMVDRSLPVVAVVVDRPCGAVAVPPSRSAGWIASASFDAAQRVAPLLLRVRFRKWALMTVQPFVGAAVDAGHPTMHWRRRTRRAAGRLLRPGGRATVRAPRAPEG